MDWNKPLAEDIKVRISRILYGYVDWNKALPGSVIHTMSYPLRVRGLKQRGCICNPYPTRGRILYGYVDWNSSTLWSTIRFISRILYGYVDWNLNYIKVWSLHLGRILYGYVDWNNIEILRFVAFTWSYPLRVRGLKQHSCIHCFQRRESYPLRVRGLKLDTFLSRLRVCRSYLM